MELYDLIIVEDEDNIRNGLINVIDWYSLGFKITGAFSSGKKAIDFMTHNNVDAVISDIVMPGISGLDFTKWLKENRPNIKTIVLSGYSNFTYAQQAIKYNVRYYLIKPTNIDELNEVMLGIRKEIDKEKQEYIKQNSQKSKQDRMKFYLQQAVFSKLIYEGMSNETLLSSMLEAIGFDIRITNFAWYFCSLAAKQTLNTPQKHYIESNSKEIEAVFNILNRNNELFYAIPVILGGSHIYTIIWSEAAKLENVSIVDSINESIRSKVDSIKSLIGFDLSLESINFYDNLPIMIRNIRDFFMDVNTENMRLSFDLSKIDEKHDKLFLTLNGILVKNDLLYINENIKNFSKDITNEKLNIRKVKEYIEKHICEDISTSDMAQSVYLNPSYLSRMFKKETGEGISEYVLRKKIEKAKELLMDPQYKVYQIAEMVGYQDIHHFYKVFKKCCGTTPSEYRNKNTIKVGEELF